MTEEANACLDTLRKAAYVGSSFDCHDCPAYTACPTGTAGWNNECIFDTAADLIESMSAELELTEAVAAQARGLECERDMLAAELEHVKYERDAAVKHLLECHKTICPTCIHRTGTGCDKNATTGPDEEVIFCADYEWCGFVR
jgi:hypothetical protein